jgi:hypothetical protein
MGGLTSRKNGRIDRNFTSCFILGHREKFFFLFKFFRFWKKKF